MARHAYVLLAVCLAFSTSARAQGESPAAPQQPAPAPAPAARPRPQSNADRPPPEYYVEPPQQGAARPPPRGAPPPPPPSGVYEPPPPGYGYGPQFVYEPPPPPKPQHVAPKYSLWLGPRLGWFIPFGSLLYHCTPVNGGADCSYSSTPWSDYASSGPMFELDAGARLSRNYNLFFLWEHAALHGGDSNQYEAAGGGLDHVNSDYFALGFRVSSDADKVGFLTEIDLGVRRFHAVYNDGSEIQFSEQVPLEARIGLGADIRISPQFSLSPMLTLGVGRFDKVSYVAPNGKESDVLGDLDELANHGWITLQMGAHFDVAGGG